MCNICDYESKEMRHLKDHIKAKHEGFKYECKICEYKTGWRQELSKHKKRKHMLASVSIKSNGISLVT